MTIVLAVWVASRIYAAGVLMYGQRAKHQRHVEGRTRSTLSTQGAARDAAMQKPTVDQSACGRDEAGDSGGRR